MPALDDLVQQASALAQGHPATAPAPERRGHDAEAEVARVLQICNACRYCEGFCAVFPAMTRRLEFGPGDAHLLANLCHNCGACLHACQYAPPHEFGVNVPRAMAQVRRRTYADYAWPKPLGGLYARNGLVLALALVASLALVVAWVMAQRLAPGGGWGTGWARGLWGTPGPQSFYAVLPHTQMVALFAPVFGWALLALAIGVRRFWRESAAPGPITPPALAEAGTHVLRLTHLGGGHGEGCNNEDDAFSLARRRWHHAVFYGFGLCFAATAVATLYHYALGRPAPYGWDSAPKLLGTTGGLLLLSGCLGLGWLNLRRHPLQADPAQQGMDRGFIALLALTAASGLALAAWRFSAALPLLLALHLGAVMALFLTLPYSKFAHGVYRAAALLRWAVERRRPSALTLGGE